MHIRSVPAYDASAPFLTKGSVMLKRQEEELIGLFKRMHPEDRLILLDYAAMRAKANAPGRGHLTLVSNSLPAERRLFDSAAS